MHAAKRVRVDRDRGSRLSRLACAVPLDVMREHSGLETRDLVAYTIAFNPGNAYIIIEARAGCGKTQMLSSLVQMFNSPEAVLLFSFTKAAIKVARVRTSQDGVTVKTQTFDSFFYHAVHHNNTHHNSGMQDYDVQELDWQSYRELAQNLTQETLETFVCRYKVDGSNDKKPIAMRYRLRDVRYILVDEAQDTPPEALDVLRIFRDMGKTVILTGDRYQSIFRFMETQSLFEKIPRSERVDYTLSRSWRCCHQVTEYIRRRFRLEMTSAIPEDHPGPSEIRVICCQSRCNSTLGRLYARMLFTVKIRVQAHVSENESKEKFDRHVLLETCSIYRCSMEEAAQKVSEREALLLKKAPRDALQLVFSTVHHYKGGECDITVLTEDVALDVECSGDGDDESENVKYVAGTRPRWGIVDLRSMRFIGHPRAWDLLPDCLTTTIEEATNGGRISGVCAHPLNMITLAGNPRVSRLISTISALHSSAAKDLGLSHVKPSCPAILNVLVGWYLEHHARQYGVEMVPGVDLARTVEHDFKYEKMSRRGLVPQETHTKVRSRMVRLRLCMLIGRHMVVSGIIHISHPLAARSAWATTVLRTFHISRSVMVLANGSSPSSKDWGAVHEVTTKIVGQGMPGLLGQAEKWEAVGINLPIPSSDQRLHLGGECDAVICDKEGLLHVITFKASTHVTYNHVCQLALQASALHINAGMVANTLCIYEATRNAISTLNAAHVHQSIMDEGTVAELNASMRARVCRRYYPQSIDLSVLDKVKVKVT